MDPEIEWYSGATRVEGGAFRGREGMRRFWTDTDAVYDELVTSIEVVRDLGEVVVGLGRLRGRSKGGVPVDTQYGLVLRYRDGLLVSGATGSPTQKPSKPPGYRNSRFGRKAAPLREILRGRCRRRTSKRVSRVIEHANRTGELSSRLRFPSSHPEIEFEDEIGAYNHPAMSCVPFSKDSPKRSAVFTLEIEGDTRPGRL